MKKTGVRHSRALTIVSREGWGARPPREVVAVPDSERTGFVVHYSAANPAQTVRAIQNYHMDTQGWSDIGYNFLVDRAGRLYEGRGWRNEGAHTLGHNRTHIAVCFIGEDGDATPAAKRSIRSLYEATNDEIGKTLSTTYHSALGATACPGDDLRSWVRAGMPTGGPGLTVDGVFGTRTVEATQEAIGVAVDGSWGTESKRGLQRHLNTRSDAGLVEDGDVGTATVKAMQRYLNRVTGAGLDIDGDWGSDTTKALQNALNQGAF